MKNILYILAVVAIGAAGVTGWQLKAKTDKKIEERNDLTQNNKNLTKNIGTKEEDKKEATATTKKALDDKNLVESELEAKVAELGEFQKTLDEEENRLEEQNARVAKVDKLIAEIKKELGDVDADLEISGVPGAIEKLRNEKNAKSKELSELELIRSKLEKKVSDAKAEIVRVETKIKESKARVRGNSFSATVSSVDNDWGFLVINAGEKSGLAGDSKLLLTRGGRLLGKVLISSLEANQSIAEVVPGSLAQGVRPQPGDTVILADTAAN